MTIVCWPRSNKVVSGDLKLSGNDRVYLDSQIEPYKARQGSPKDEWGH